MGWWDGGGLALALWGGEGLALRWGERNYYLL